MSDETVDPMTVEHIRAQGTRDDKIADYRCGCFRWSNDSGWWLCDYHEGFDEGIDRMRRVVEKQPFQGDRE